jgi:hypothetical protein
MPWCDTCSKYWAPNTMTPEGACPECKKVLATKGALRMEARSLGVAAPGETEGEVPKTPWHFKVMIIGLVIYLAWRGVQGVEWLIHHV